MKLLATKKVMSELLATTRVMSELFRELMAALRVTTYIYIYIYINKNAYQNVGP